MWHYLNSLHLYCAFLVLTTTKSSLQYSSIIHPFTQTFIQCIYVQHFLYHTSLIHCWHSYQGQFGVQYLAQGHAEWGRVGSNRWPQRMTLSIYWATAHRNHWTMVEVKIQCRQFSWISFTSYELNFLFVLGTLCSGCGSTCCEIHLFGLLLWIIVGEVSHLLVTGSDLTLKGKSVSWHIFVDMHPLFHWSLSLNAVSPCWGLLCIFFLKKWNHIPWDCTKINVPVYCRGGLTFSTSLNKTLLDRWVHNMISTLSPSCVLLCVGYIKVGIRNESQWKM